MPGWFQAALTLYDATGKELAYADDFRFHPDPVLYYEIPEDGEYVLEIQDAIYRGREDFVYRITLGELPFVTGIFPLGGRRRRQTAVDLQGWNLPADTTDGGRPATSARACVPFPCVAGNTQSPTACPSPRTRCRNASKRSRTTTPPTPSGSELPMIVNGRIDPARRLGRVPLRGPRRRGDRRGSQRPAGWARRWIPCSKLTDAAGKQLAFNDDHEDKAAGLITHHADSLLSVTLPGRRDVLSCTWATPSSKGGAEYAYRLRISAPRPDFELRSCRRASTSAPALPPITVYALRKDGFTARSPSACGMRRPASRWTAAGCPAGQDQARGDAGRRREPLGSEPVRLALEGRAAIAGREVARRPSPPTT